MRIYLYFLLMIDFFNLNSQVWSENYCLNFLIELAEKDSSISEMEIENAFGSKVDSFNFHLKTLYFNKSDKIVTLLSKNNNFIDKLHPEWVTDHGSVREDIYYSIYFYLESLNYKAKDNLELVYEILESSSHNLLYIPLEKINASQLIDLYVNQNEDRRISMYSTIASRDLFNKVQLDSFWAAIDTIEKHNLEFYLMKLDFANRFEDPKQRDSIINQVKRQFVKLMDTHNPRHVLLYKQSFDFDNYLNELATESIRKNDSIRLAEKSIEAQKIHQKNDSIINTIDWSKWSNVTKNDLIEMAKSGEDIEPYVSFDPATLSPEEYREYLALLDTTLHDLNDEYFSPRIGDDGKRFDALSNGKLFLELERVNLRTIKQEYDSEYKINTQPKVIYLQKIVQLIGDRYISNRLLPSANQQTQIYELLDFIENEIKVDSNQVWNRIAIELLYRLWHLSVPRLKSWVTSEERFLQEFAWQNLHFFADEAMVLELVQKFEAEYLDGNKYNATKYLAPLQNIDLYKQIELSQFNLPPRRIPSRTFDQSYEWCQKYIWPAFLKAGWLVEEKK